MILLNMFYVHLVFRPDSTVHSTTSIRVALEESDGHNCFNNRVNNRIAVHTSIQINLEQQKVSRECVESGLSETEVSQKDALLI